VDSNLSRDYYPLLDWDQRPETRLDWRGDS
jgi:hypothetical protein